MTTSDHQHFVLFVSQHVSTSGHQHLVLFVSHVFALLLPSLSLVGPLVMTGAPHTETCGTPAQEEEEEVLLRGTSQDLQDLPRLNRNRKR